MGCSDVKATSLNPEQAGVLLALLFGDKERLEKGEAERFRSLGVMHVFAIMLRYFM